jgi:23S rRNA (guanosine2251-2'-O)-methyltransferase
VRDQKRPRGPAATSRHSGPHSPRPRSQGATERTAPAQRSGKPALRRQEGVRRTTPAVSVRAANRPPVEDKSLVVYGRRAVIEALRAERTVNRLWVDESTPSAAFAAVFEAANARGIHVERVPRAKLEAQAGPHHQGVVALCAPVAYVDIDTLLARAEARGEAALLVLLDGVQDPQNIGSLIRTAEVAGAHGVVLPERRAGAVTPTVVRAAAGAALVLPIARVKNLAQAALRLQEAGVQVVVAHPTAQELVYEVDMRGPTAIVVGGEGQGVSDLLRRRADRVVALPQAGTIGSLNAAVAGALMVYEAVRQRSLGARP